MIHASPLLRLTSELFSFVIAPLPYECWFSTDCCSLGVLLNLSSWHYFTVTQTQRYKLNPFLEDIVTHFFDIYNCMLNFYFIYHVQQLLSMYVP